MRLPRSEASKRNYARSPQKQTMAACSELFVNERAAAPRTGTHG